LNEAAEREKGKAKKRKIIFFCIFSLLAKQLPRVTRSLLHHAATRPTWGLPGFSISYGGGSDAPLQEEAAKGLETIGHGGVGRSGGNIV